MKAEPYTYDMTFCVSECKYKCERHISKYKFEIGRLISQVDFNCEGEKDDRTRKIKRSN